MSFKKDKILQVRVNQKDLAEIEKMAIKRGMNISDFIRYCIMFYSIHNREGLYSVDKNNI